MTESTNFSSRFTRMESFIQQLQDEICQALEKKDSRKFQEDCWKRKEGGGGRTRVLENGSFLEKGGVNISSVHGPMSDELAKQLGTKASFFGACGISLVLHPRSPKIPTVHMNLRYFETPLRGLLVWWRYRPDSLFPLSRGFPSFSPNPSASMRKMYSRFIRRIQEKL